MKLSHAHGYLGLALQAVFFVLFWIFVRYHPNADAPYHPLPENATEHQRKMEKYKSDDVSAHSKVYPMFQDVHVMVFVGFGFLMTFLKRYGFSAVGLNFLTASLCLQWAILVNGFFHLKDATIFVDLGSLLGADFAAASVLISFGALLGKTTPTQLLLLTVLEIPLFAVNEVVGRSYIGAVDMGDSMFVHAFGAYFGMAASLALRRRDVATDKEASSRVSDMFAMIGTIFLWVYWPSFNGGAAVGDDQQRAIVNTFLSLVSCCCASFALSSLLQKDGKFDMVHVQNSTLAGGVAVGTAADLMVHPWGAVLVGVLAACVSVLGYVFLTPFLASRLGVHDTCGVHNLHGMPGVLAGVVGCVAAALASEASYGPSLYEVFPLRAPPEGSEALEALRRLLPELPAGRGRSAALQAGSQMAALVVTIVVAVAGGLLTGAILRVGALDALRTEELYEDGKYWLLEEAKEEDDDEEEMEDVVAVPMDAEGGNAKEK